MICYHGTTLKAYKAILSGSDYKEATCWNVSDNDGAFYVFPENKLVESMEYEHFDQHLQHTFEQAITQAPAYKDENLIVLVLDIPDHLLEDDHSCENMDTIASFVPLCDLNLSWIKSVYHAKTSQYYFPVIVSTLLDNRNFTGEYIEPAVMTIAEALKGSDAYSHLVDDLYSFEIKKLPSFTKKAA